MLLFGGTEISVHLIVNTYLFMEVQYRKFEVWFRMIHCYLMVKVLVTIAVSTLY